MLHSRLWRGLQGALEYDYQTTLFQPVGGMDMIAKAFAREVGDLVRLNAKVTAIRQDDTASASPGRTPQPARCSRAGPIGAFARSRFPC